LNIPCRLFFCILSVAPSGIVPLPGRAGLLVMALGFLAFGPLKRRLARSPA